MQKIYIFAFISLFLFACSSAQKIKPEPVVDPYANQSPSGLEAIVDIFISEATYEVIPDTANVIYMNKCSRKKLKPFEWKKWEGFSSVETFVQAVGNITVQKKRKVSIIASRSFVDKAIETSAEMGGNLLCFVNIKKVPDVPGIDTVIFRSYKQIFKFGNASLETYYKENLLGGLPLTLQNVNK